MLRQDLQDANETLAARTAEVDELKARVAELEQLQQDQQRLIQMKDNELAAAQQRAATAAPETASAAGLPLWLWIVPALLLAAIVAVLLTRRRRAAGPVVPAAGRGSPSWGSAESSASMPARTADADPPAVPVADFEPVSSPAWQARGLSTAYAQPASDGSAVRDPRLDKAHACIDQGDLHGARNYLNDVLANADPAAQAEASRLLRDLT